MRSSGEMSFVRKCRTADAFPCIGEAIKNGCRGIADCSYKNMELLDESQAVFSENFHPAIKSSGN